MIEEVNQNILSAIESLKVNIIAHCSNCFCTFGSGIAKDIKLKYPGSYLADLQTKSGDITKLGTFTKSVTELNYYDNVTIYNLYGQYNYGKPDPNNLHPFMCYDKLMDAFIAMKKDLEHHMDLTIKNNPKLDKDSLREEYKIGFPKIGCGLAGGDWRIVKLMIENVFNNYNVKVYYV